MSRLFVIFSMVALLSAACGNGASGSDPELDPTPTQDESPAVTDIEATSLKIGILPIMELSPLFLGMEKGFFAEENVELETEFAAGGAAIIPALVAGELQVGYSNIVSLFIAQSSGLDVRIIAAGGKTAPDDEPQPSGIGVRADSGIETATDLEGATIGTGTVQNINDITVKAVVEKAGGDPDSLTFVEVPLPEMPGAIDRGDVDAGVLTEPFTSIGTESLGLEIVTHHFEEAIPGLTIAYYFTTAEYAEANPDAIGRFITAINRTNEYAAANPDEVRAITPTFTEMDPESAEQVAMAGFGADLGVEQAREVADLMVKYGLIDDAPDVAGLFLAG